MGGEHPGMEENKDNHVVMFPYMAQGHFIPFVNLAKKLSAQGFTVTLLTTTANASKLQSHLRLEAADLSIRVVSLSLTPLDGLPPGLECTEDLSSLESVLLFFSCRQLSAPFEKWLEHEITQKPLCIISDVFHCYWLVESASKLGMPCLAFHTTGALGASVLQYFFTNPVDEIIGNRQTIEIRHRCMNITFRRSEIPVIFQREYPFSPDTAERDMLMPKSYILSKEGCAATLVNTFEAIELASVQYLQETTGKPVFAVASSSYPLSQETQTLHHQSDFIGWLECQKPRSVLYISFGSQAFLSENQMQALVKGIEGSKQPFLWTIKDLPGSNITSYELLPEGFVEATRDRGLIIRGWVPQKQILSHPSIGCFVSHCGWNSTLESICAGVPMVVWPMAFEQPINAKLVEEEFRIGLRVCDGDDQVPCGNVVESKVEAAMGEEMYKQTQALKRSIDDAKSGESNIRALVCFIRNLSKG